MNLTFIGTSSGKTSLNRFHSSLLFQDATSSILIDSGDGISKALLSQNISPNSITHLIISHYHSDHFAGLPSLLTQMIIENRKEKLIIFTHTELIKSLIYFLNISSIFLEKLQFEVEIIGFGFNKLITINESFSFSAKQNSHVKNKYDIQKELVKFISASFLFKLNDKNVVYTSDIGNYDDLFLFQDYEAHLFITESTHIPLNKIEDAMTILNPKKAILTHIEDEEEIEKWYDKLSNEKKKPIQIAKDGMNIII